MKLSKILFVTGLMMSASAFSHAADVAACKGSLCTSASPCLADNNDTYCYYENGAQITGVNSNNSPTGYWQCATDNGKDKFYPCQNLKESAG